MGPDDSVVEPDFKKVYEVNKRHIFRAHSLGKVVQSYNFPTENLSGGVDEIMGHLEDLCRFDCVYKNQKNAFKINLNLGFILRDKISNERRSYIPFKNSYIFDKPQRVTSSKSLKRLRNKIA